jgi:hypothetical protein
MTKEATPVCLARSSFELPTDKIVKKELSQAWCAMNIPFDEILACVRQSVEPQTAFNALREIGRSHLKSPLWDAVPVPDCDADIGSAADWLQRNISEYRPTGVYLGLDTLNEKDGQGQNVEIGMTADADPLPLEMEWIFDGLDYGDKHLIRGVYEIHKSHDAFELDHPESLLPDYVFFLGYSGIVLASALERMQVGWNSLFVLGFHDGDMGFLARSSQSGVERLATLPNE